MYQTITWLIAIKQPPSYLLPFRRSGTVRTPN
jgi:hypothetical protein